LDIRLTEKINQTIEEMERVLQALKEIENGTMSNNIPTSNDQNAVTASHIPLILQDFCSEYSNITNNVTL